MLAACSEEDMMELRGRQMADGLVKVHLSVGTADGTATTRAWVDNVNAETKEMMNVWTVVAVNNADNKVAAIYACKPSGEPDQEIDDVTYMAPATYRFYSFANMSPTVVMQLLGIGGAGTPTRADGDDGNGDPTGGDGNQTGGNGDPTGGNNDPTGGNNDATGRVTPNGNLNDPDPFMNPGNNSIADNTIYNIAFTEGATVTADAVAAKTVNVAGNGFEPTAANDFGATGIPMSNVQTINVTEESTIDLIVIRMIAKIEIQVYNNTGKDAEVEYITLTDLTRNTDNNLRLLPRLTAGANTMEYVHSDIQPNLNPTAPGTGEMKNNYTTGLQRPTRQAARPSSSRSTSTRVKGRRTTTKASS